MRSPLKYPGGKSYLAPWIVSLMPPHQTYVEPYFGGGSVLFAKDPEGTSEVVNDLDGDLMNFWNVLRDPVLFASFDRQAQATPFSEGHWEAAASKRSWREGPEYLVARALDFFILVRQSLAGRGTEFTSLTRTRLRRGMNEQVSAWLSAVEGLEEVHTRLKRVAVLNREATKVIQDMDHPDTLFYLDPPYLHETRVTTQEYGENEMTEAQHAVLLDCVKGCRGKVMLSGYDSSLYSRELASWTRHTKEIANHASHGKTKPRKQEVLWCNW